MRVALFLMTTLLTGTAYAQLDRDWPRWRGPLDNGAAAPDAKPPTEWSEQKNIRWKVEIPGRSHASPVVLGNRVYVQTAVPLAAPDTAQETAEEQSGDGGDRRRGGRGRGESTPPPPHKFVVMALDRATGDVVWQQVVREEAPHEAGHPDASPASASPLTDGERIYAHFGSRGIFCLDLNGKVLWDVDLGNMRTRRGFGEGSSPALHGDTLVVNWDHEDESFVVALDKRTGKERWRKSRDEQTSWSTPLIVEVDGKPQVIISATRRVRSYDLSTGELVWECAGMTENVIPSPMYERGLVYVISGFRGAAVRAIRVDQARGDVTDSPAIAWSYDKNTPYVPSALLYDGLLYFLDNNRGIITCLDARSGEVRYGPERLPDIRNVYASLVGANGMIYVLDRGGTMQVLRAGPKFEVVATNVLDDGFDASPAVAGREMFLRGNRFLYCLAE